MGTISPTPVRLVYGLVLGLLFVWLGALWAAPQLLCSGHEWAALLLYRGFSLICHQRSERSFYWCGSPLAVCVRCTGIYSGAILGGLLYPVWQGLAVQRLPARRYLFGALLLLLLDWSVGVTGLVQHYSTSRLATGLLAGAVSMFYILPLLLWGSNRIIFRNSKRKPEGD